MSKLPEEFQFWDLSDYGRPIARKIANALKFTSATPIHLTLTFILSGLIAIFCILNGFYILAAFFLVLKSILDAADGEIARLKHTPSYTGRYLDSVADIILNLLFIFTIGYVTEATVFQMVLAFLGIQLQGTLYNYYYVILRNKVDGDTTSRIFEDKPPLAFEGESQKTVSFLFFLFKLLYVTFDKTIFHLDKSAVRGKRFPNWFMTSVSAFGLGFQLLIMSFLMILNLIHFIIPFFIYYTLFIFVIIGIRRYIS